MGPWRMPPAALRALAWGRGKAGGGAGESIWGDAGDEGFEIVVLKCPLGPGAMKAAAAQFADVARLARLKPEGAHRAAAALTDGLAALRARADRELGGADQPCGRKPWIFIEADPELYSADSGTPLGAALMEALGVGNIADPVGQRRLTLSNPC